LQETTIFDWKTYGLLQIFPGKIGKIVTRRGFLGYHWAQVLCMGVAVGNVGMTPDELRPGFLLGHAHGGSTDIGEG
jgi:hypothetical protein